MYRLTCRNAPEAVWTKPDWLAQRLYELLRARGVRSDEEARAFLQPLDLPLGDPFAMRGAPEATALLRKAIERREPICVYGDYDVDGVSACAILVGALERLGADVRCRIPSRADEGYGLHRKAVLQIAEEGVRLLITVDCGISDRESVALAKSMGLTVIVTDHHRADENALPECTLVTAYRSAYPCANLCGAGVAYRLACALDPACEEAFIDLAALATVADIVPMLGENRAIVARGLQKLNREQRPGIRALLQVAGAAERQITEETLGFQLGPRLNAGGRLGSAQRAYALLRAVSEQEAESLAQELDRENSNRREQETQILRETESMLQTYDFVRHRAIVLRGNGWNAGVIGIVASRLVEKYRYPVVLLTANEGELKGSCRSIAGIDIYLALKACSDCLTRFGGHAAAAGLSLPEEGLGAFMDALDDYLRTHTDAMWYVPEYVYDIAVAPAEIDIDICEELDALRPCGMNNPAPVALIAFEPQNVRRIGRDGSHLRLDLAGPDGKSAPAVWFGHGDMLDELSEPVGRLAIGSVRRNEYHGFVSAQCQIASLLPPANDALLSRARPVSHTFLTSILYTDCQKTNAGSITLAECADFLQNKAQGVAFVCATAMGAAAFLDGLQNAGVVCPDLCLGDWPEDRRCFNALSLAPEVPPPAGYALCIAVDMPARLLTGRIGGTILQLTGLDYVDDWPEALPDLDALRNAYRVVRRIVRNDSGYANADLLALAASRASGLAANGLYAALLAFQSMGLIVWQGDRVEAPESGRIDPMQDTVYRNIALMRERRSRS